MTNNKKSKVRKGTKKYLFIEQKNSEKKRLKS